ncbi:DUF6777 domain-containing protein [Streptomyces sp. AM6-12]|uniref:DUF6777 domain-containing protein n=1 Tax=Streptomyces sp. AM6-12 TaxID=3345149 RepID=UPI0037AD521A
MRIPTGSMVMACVLLSVALLLTGCAGAAVKEAQLGEEVFLQPAAEQGPSPFTASTATGRTGLGTPRPSATVRTADVSAPPAGLAVAPLSAARVLSGGTPGLYSGRVRVTECDVERQIGGLTGDPARSDAFAHAAGAPRTDLPGYLRALTPVLLRADTRVTTYGYRDGRTNGYQAVLQAGTAVLVDDRGLPRVRCACGNPLRPPEEARGGVGARGTGWSGYRPAQVIVVTPAPRAMSSLTLLDAGTNTWIQRRTGPDVRRDRLVAPPPVSATSPPDPGHTGLPSSPQPDTGGPSPRASRSSTATGEIGGALIDTGRVAPRRGRDDGRDAGHGDRADGSGKGQRERSPRAANRATTTHTGDRPDTGPRPAATAGDGGHGPDGRGTAAPGAATGSGNRAADRPTIPGTTGEGGRASAASATPGASGGGSRVPAASATPGTGGGGPRRVGASVTSGTTGKGTRAPAASAPSGTGGGRTGVAAASSTPGTTAHVSRTAPVSASPRAAGVGTRTAEASGMPRAATRGTRTAAVSSAPATTAHSTRTAEARVTSAAPGRGTATPTTPAVLPATALPPDVSTPPATPTPTPVLHDPLAQLPDASLWDPPLLVAPPAPQTPDEIGAPDVTDTPATPAARRTAEQAAPAPADVLGG